MLLYNHLTQVMLWPRLEEPNAVSALLQAQTMAKMGPRMLAFFDAKNDGVIRLYQGQNRYQRVPSLNVASLNQFVSAALSCMKSQRDFLVILSGKLRSNEAGAQV